MTDEQFKSLRSHLRIMIALLGLMTLLFAGLFVLPLMGR
jgi:hypothetical protein